MSLDLSNQFCRLKYVSHMNARRSAQIGCSLETQDRFCRELKDGCSAETHRIAGPTSMGTVDFMDIGRRYNIGILFLEQTTLDECVLEPICLLKMVLWLVEERPSS